MKTRIKTRGKKRNYFHDIMTGFFIICIVGVSYFLISDSLTSITEAAELKQGKSLYEQHCMICHGEKGEGDGPAARFLFPKPRDLSSGLFKVRSTPTGDPPTDKDISLTIKNGMPGSSMPSLSELSEKEIKAIVEYVKDLGDITEGPERIIQPGMPPAVTPELVAKGKKVYEKMKCWECHGYDGKGDGPKAKDLKDDWKQPAPPNTFTVGIYKGGGTPSDIYLRFTTGLDGSPMPSYEDSLGEEARWALVFYTLSLSGPSIAMQPTSGQIVAKMISEEIPSDPENGLWQRATAFKIPLMFLWQIPDSPQRVINVKALNNEKDIAFLVEWTDATRNSLLDLDIFRDGVALQFPGQKKAKPAFWMGEGEGKEREGMVNIWFWKADAQERKDKDELNLQSPVENLIAGGFGTLTLLEEETQQVFGKGTWIDGKWRVVFKRKFKGARGNARFTRGKLTPVSFAVWDGKDGDAGGRKAVSTWYYVIPEGT
jgi:DMSO reductase family type II enzyme heme b subunit